jgi:hypothetical protein
LNPRLHDRKVTILIFANAFVLVIDEGFTVGIALVEYPNEVLLSKVGVVVLVEPVQAYFCSYDLPCVDVADDDGAEGSGPIADLEIVIAISDVAGFLTRSGRTFTKMGLDFTRASVCCSSCWWLWYWYWVEYERCSAFIENAKSIMTAMRLADVLGRVISRQ